MYQALKALAIFVAILMAMVIGFAAGVIADRSALIPLTGLIDIGPVSRATRTSPNELNLELINEAYRVIQERYADREALAETDLTYGALTGMVDALGDTGHSRFLTPKMVEAEASTIQGELEGIGALLNVNEAGNPVILAPMDGSPAQRAGLEPGDIIIEVDGVDVSTTSLTEVVERVTGPAGTDVTLTIMDPDTQELREVTITRERIILQNVTWKMLPGTNIAHLRIAGFSNDVSGALISALREIDRQGAQGIILDLRNNPGGLLNEAVNVVSQFLPEGSLVMQAKDADGNVRSIPVRRGGIATEIPLVVLINQGSASAAEITAGAIQDYNRGTLVGQTTFGTGTVLNQFSLSDGSAILLATELWLTPKGREIWHEGIAPDVEVELPDGVTVSIPETERDWTEQDLANTKDTQLKRALEIIQEAVR